MELTSIELFAGAGGLALGLEKAGFISILLNEFDKNASSTLKQNRPYWNVSNKDIHEINFLEYKGKIDLLTGGFPCQAFSHSGKRLGFNDVRGTLFYEYARAIKEIQPLCFLAENVKGLVTHNNGDTLKTIINVFSELDYHIFKPLLLNAVDYETAQKRERIFIFGVKKSIKDKFKFEAPETRKHIALKDIFYKGDYYNKDVEMCDNEYTKYSDKKIELFKHIPEGGNWKNLPDELKKEYLGKMFYSGGGKTGILKRLSMEQPSVTILTSPSQKQTDRCHPKHIRPLSVRESARIQGFPDDWMFCGSISSKYKQIGNAVPVNLAYHLTKDIYRQIYEFKK